MNFKFILDPQRIKHTCPACGHNHVFVRYVDAQTGKYVGDQYGWCDRHDNCNYHKQPPNQSKLDSDSNVEYKKVSFDETDNCDFETYKSYIGKPVYTQKWYKLSPFDRKKYISNMFIEGLYQYFNKSDVDRVVKLYQIANFYDSGTMYPYILNNALKSAKIMWYDHNLNRIKEGKKSYPMWYHNFHFKDEDGFIYETTEIENFTFRMPFFGSQLLYNNTKKPIGIVEAEKSAVIMAIIIPEMHWIATGGLNNFTFDRFKTLFTYGDFYIFPDISLNAQQYWKDKTEKISPYFKNEFNIIDYIPQMIKDDQEIYSNLIDSGADIADFVLFGEEYQNWIKNKMNKIVTF